MAKTSESEIGRAVMQILANQPNREASVQTMIKRMPGQLNLTEDDLKPSETRPNEVIWEQRVRNLRSHHKTVGNVIAEGFVERVGRGRYRLTDAGLLHLKNVGLV